MKLSDFLFNIGRPVAFYPGLVKALGSMKQAVFVCQMAYWKDKGSDPDGWIYKTSEEIEEETSLTYKEQIRVRAVLVEIKALEEKYARTEHQMYFRVNWDVVNDLWDKHMTNGHMPKRKVAYVQRGDGTLPSVISLNSNTYSTADSTSKITSVEKPDMVDMMIEQGKKANSIQEACNAFESIFGFGVLNWDSKPVWRKFAQWVFNTRLLDSSAFKDYVAWRNGKGQYTGAMTNTSIRRDPQIFMDTGWPTFLAYASIYPSGENKVVTNEPKGFGAIRQFLEEQNVNPT